MSPSRHAFHILTCNIVPQTPDFLRSVFHVCNIVPHTPDFVRSVFHVNGYRRVYFIIESRAYSSYIPGAFYRHAFSHPFQLAKPLNILGNPILMENDVVDICRRQDEHYL